MPARAENRPGGSSHLTTNAVVEVDADRASATSYVTVVAATTPAGNWPAATTTSFDGSTVTGGSLSGV